MKLLFKTLRSFNGKEKLLSALLLLVFSIGLFSILMPETTFIASSGKAYSEGLVGEIIHLNPVYTEFSEADADVSSLLFSGLVKYDAVSGDFEEDIATHTLSEDQLTYTFTLKNDIYWHDGVEMSAEDLYFTFAEVIQSPEFENPVLQSNFEGVKIDLVNTRTISFTLNSPNSFFFTALTVGILPHHILGDVPVLELDTNAFNQKPVGSGPYKVENPYEIDSDGSTTVVLTVNENYYGELPRIATLRFVAFPTLNALVENRSKWNGAARIRQSMLSEMDLDGLVTNQYELPQYTALFLNTDSPFLQKNKERLGFSKAISKEKILESVSYKVRIDTPLLELDQEEWLFEQNIEEAQGALFDAGWSLAEGESIRTNGDGEPLSVRLVRRDFSEDNPVQEETMQITADLIQAQLNDAGVEVRIETYPLDVLQEVIANRDYDMLLYGQSLGYNLDTFAYWHSSQASAEGLNISNYQNPNADVLIEKIRMSFDADEKEALLEDLATTLAQDVPAIFLYTPSYYYLTSTKLTGVDIEKPLLPKDRFSNIAEWEFN